MSKIIIKQNPKVLEKFKLYPNNIRKKINNLRSLILDAANEIEGIKEIEETLKWNEPSYLVKNGSTIRMDWKNKKPNQYAIYFKCTSKLVSTFKSIYGNIFKYENNRAIVFNLNEEIPKMELKHCIKMALQYHLLKDKPLLGN